MDEPNYLAIVMIAVLAYVIYYFTVTGLIKLLEKIAEKRKKND